MSCPYTGTPCTNGGQLKTVTLVSQKGGSGKSTLAINLAVAASHSKKRVLIIDLDPQKTAEAWYQERTIENPSLVVATAQQLPDAISRAEVANIDLVVIDTPGRDEPATASAIRQADYCLIPCRPTPADLLAIPPTLNTIKRLVKPFAFVLTQTPPKGSRIHEALSGLSKLHSDVSPLIVSRVTYQDAQGAPRTKRGQVQFSSFLVFPAFVVSIPSRVSLHFA